VRSEVKSYEFGYKKGRNRTIKVSAETDDVAKAAADLLLKSVQRKQEDREAVRELTAVARYWREQADKITRPSDAIKSVYLARSREAIDAAGRILAEGER
jgi:predicted alpha-1,6-mannanase (GH76 family)